MAGMLMKMSRGDQSILALTTLTCVACRFLNKSRNSKRGLLEKQVTSEAPQQTLVILNFVATVASVARFGMGRYNL